MNSEAARAKNSNARFERAFFYEGRMEELLSWGWAIVMPVIGWFVRAGIKVHDEKHKELAALLATKADADDLKRTQAHVEKLFDQARQDKTEIIGAIRDLGDKIGQIQVSVVEQLARKVDREELRR